MRRPDEIARERAHFAAQAEVCLGLATHMLAEARRLMTLSGSDDVWSRKARGYRSTVAIDRMRKDMVRKTHLWPRVRDALRERRP